MGQWYAFLSCGFDRNYFPSSLGLSRTCRLICIQSRSRPSHSFHLFFDIPPTASTYSPSSPLTFPHLPYALLLRTHEENPGISFRITKRFLGQKRLHLTLLVELETFKTTSNSTVVEGGGLRGGDSTLLNRTDLPFWIPPRARRGYFVKNEDSQFDWTDRVITLDPVSK